MTLVDPVAASHRVNVIRKQGRVVVGCLAGLAAIGFCMWFFNTEFIRSRDTGGLVASVANPKFLAIATISCAFTTGWIWNEFTQIRPQFSWALSVAAGLVALVVALPLAWVLDIVLWEINEIVSAGGVREIRGVDGQPIHPLGYLYAALLLPILGAVFMSYFALVLTGIFTLPIAVAVCLVTTAWARWRLRREGLASYAFVKTGHGNAGQWPKQ